MSLTNGQTLSRGQAEAWLSGPRFTTYLHACDGSVGDALKLYEWNIDLGNVLMKDIAYLEIALRNAYDRVLMQHWHEGDGKGKRHWLFDEDSPVRRPLVRKTSSGARFDANALNRSKIEDALPKGAISPNANKVIANLSFGFWAHMTDRAHERALWIPAIHRAWPKGTDRSELDAKLRLVNTERNRIAHHEHLFNMKDGGLSPINIDRTVIELLRALLPDIDIFSDAGTTPVERFVHARPMEVDIGFTRG